MQKFLMVFHANNGSGLLEAGLDASLVAAAFNQSVSLLVLDRKSFVFNIKNNTDLQEKLSQLQELGFDHLYCPEENTCANEIHEPMKIIFVDKKSIRKLMDSADTIVSY